MGKPGGLPRDKEGEIQIINFTTAISCFSEKEPTLPRTSVSVGSGSVVLRALALLGTGFFEMLPSKSS